MRNRDVAGWSHIDKDELSSSTTITSQIYFKLAGNEKFFRNGMKIPNMVISIPIYKIIFHINKG